MLYCILLYNLLSFLSTLFILRGLQIALYSLNLSIKLKVKLDLKKIDLKKREAMLIKCLKDVLVSISCLQMVNTLAVFVKLLLICYLYACLVISFVFVKTIQLNNHILYFLALVSSKIFQGGASSF